MFKIYNYLTIIITIPLIRYENKENILKTSQNKM